MSVPTTIKCTFPARLGGQIYNTTHASRRDARAHIVRVLAQNGHITNERALNQAFFRANEIVREGIKFEIFDVSESVETREGLRQLPNLRTDTKRAASKQVRELNWIRNKITQYEKEAFDARQEVMAARADGASEAKLKAVLEADYYAQAILKLARQALREYFGLPALD